MKKILFIFGSFFVGLLNTFAFTNDFAVKSSGFLCSNDEIYEVYDMSLEGRQFYYLYPSHDYNLDMRDYSEVNFEEQNIDVLVKDFAYNNYFFRGNDKLNLFIQKMIWEKTTDKKYNLCDKDGNNLYYPENYDDVYSFIIDLQKGPGIPEKIELVYGTSTTISSKYLDYYRIDGLDNLDYDVIDKSTYSISGEIGEYNLSFVKEENGGEELYFDGENFLMPSGMRAYQVFNTNIVIDNPTLIISNGFADDVDIPTTELCFRLYNKKFDQNFCSDEKGIAKIKAPMGIYKLESLTDLNNSYSGDDIVLKTFKKEINIFWSEGAIKDDPSTVKDIIPSDTLEYGGLIVLALVFCGVFLVIKKNKTN